MEKMMKSRVIEQGGKYYEAAVGLEKTKLASRIAKKLTNFDESTDTYKSLMKHAQRAQKPDAVAALIKLAEKNLNPEQLDDLKELTKSEDD
jgi:hypothetical protein